MSTSANEYNYNDYFYGRDETYFRNSFEPNPFYPTMGQPTVYYAEMPQPIVMQTRGRERQKDNPNCFVKAFRWYTQELVPKREVSPNKPNTTGFAEWLDTKYDEFLKLSQKHSQVSFEFKMKMSSEAFAKDRIPKKCNCDSFTVKIPREKSPFQRRRRTRSNESGDARKKSTESLRYLMQPKHSSRPASDCCRSLSGESENTKRLLCKSKSFSSFAPVNRSNELANAAPVQSNAKNKPCTCKPLGEKSIENVEKPVNHPMITKQEFGCQTCEEKPLKVDVGSQYDVMDSANSSGYVPSKNFERVDKCACTSCEIVAVNPSHRVSVCTPRQTQENSGSKSHKNVECQCPEEKVKFVDAQNQHEEAYPNRLSHVVCECCKGSNLRINVPPKQKTATMNDVCPCETKVIENFPTEGQTVKLSQIAAQTSNHSIFLANATAHKYPLFLKIVCADKL